MICKSGTADEVSGICSEIKPYQAKATIVNKKGYRLKLYLEILKEFLDEYLISLH